MTIAVPVSWHIGSTPPAAMLAFFSRSSATNRSLPRGLRVVEDPAQLREVGRAQEVRDVAHRLGGQQLQCLGRDVQELLAAESDDLDAFASQQAVFGGVGPDRQQIGVGKIGHPPRIGRG